MTTLIVLLFGTMSVNDLPLFSVKKSNNRNELHYFIRVDALCRPIADHPVAVRWLMRERGEDQWEELLPLERPFYALAEQRSLDPDRVLTHVRAAPEHAFVVRVKHDDAGCSATAETALHGKPVTVQGVVVELGVLSVKAATLFGRSLADGRSIAERIQ